VHFRRWVGSSLAVFAMSAIALTAVGLRSPSVAFASSAQSASQTALVASQTRTFPWKGHDPSCEIRLPIPGHIKYGQFTTCPPKRLLLLGDSVAVTMGIQMSLDQDNWGTVVDVVGIDGCGFVTGYDVKYLGAWVPMNRACSKDVSAWDSAIRSFRPQAIVVEMGWWDSYQHMIDGRAGFLTQPKYDAVVKRRIVGFTHSIEAASPAPIYFLSVPWMQPTALSQGRPELPASSAFHNEINSLIRSATQATGTHFIDVSPYVTPAGHFQANVGGGICRASDGVHFYVARGRFLYVHTECGRALQRGILSMIRQSLMKE
jgi:hypothetical protein